MLLAGYGGLFLERLSFTQAGNLADMRYQTQEKNDCTKFTCRKDNGLVPVFQHGGMLTGVLIAYAIFPKHQFKKVKAYFFLITTPPRCRSTDLKHQVVASLVYVGAAGVAPGTALRSPANGSGKRSRRWRCGWRPCSRRKQAGVGTRGPPPTRWRCMLHRVVPSNGPLNTLSYYLLFFFTLILFTLLNGPLQCPLVQRHPLRPLLRSCWIFSTIRAAKSSF